VFTERSRRLWAASEARALGHGGIGVVERATGISRPTIQRGLRELKADTVMPPERTCRPGGGGNRRPSAMRRCCAISMLWSSRPRPAIRTRPGAGRAKALERWRSRSEPWGTRSATPSSPSCCTSWATPCRVTSRRAKVANRTGHHGVSLPPGRSKWNKIEHRLFSHIAMNWRGTPLVSLAAIVSLIASTRSRSGLRVRSELDRRHYPDGVKAPDKQMARVRLQRHAFHGDCNYTILPAPPRRHRSLIS